jgi:hypothetical protein
MTVTIAVHAATSVLPGKYAKTVVVNLGPMDVVSMQYVAHFKQIAVLSNFQDVLEINAWGIARQGLQFVVARVVDSMRHG